MKFPIPAAITLSLLLCSQTALAEIINTGNSIIDTETGLEWLDLTQTQGLSWNEAEASQFVTVDGYSHASAIAVGELMINAGFRTIENKNEPGNDAAAQLLLSFLGCTQFCGTINATGRGFAFYNDTQTVRPNYHTGGLRRGATTISLFSANKKPGGSLRPGIFSCEWQTRPTPPGCCRATCRNSASCKAVKLICISLPIQRRSISPSTGAVCPAVRLSMRIAQSRLTPMLP